MKRFIRNNLAAVCILAAAAVFLLLGVYRGEVMLVFAKAVRICMECIGLG